MNKKSKLRDSFYPFFILSLFVHGGIAYLLFNPNKTDTYSTAKIKDTEIFYTIDNNNNIEKRDFPKQKRTKKLVARKKENPLPKIPLPPPELALEDNNADVDVFDTVAVLKDKQKGTGLESLEDMLADIRRGGIREGEDEATVSLDSDNIKYLSYLQKVKKQIEMIWTYPYDAALRGEKGVSEFFFVIDSRGNLEKIIPVTSSGYVVLDDEASNSIRKASPFPEFPKHWKMKKLNILARFYYILY